jgi:hypothetical protein
MVTRVTGHAENCFKSAQDTFVSLPGQHTSGVIAWSQSSRIENLSGGYPHLSHGMCTVNKDQINADLLAFLGGAK